MENISKAMRHIDAGSGETNHRKPIPFEDFLGQLHGKHQRLA